MTTKPWHGLGSGSEMRGGEGSQKSLSWLFQKKVDLQVLGAIDFPGLLSSPNEETGGDVFEFVHATRPGH